MSDRLTMKKPEVDKLVESAPIRLPDFPIAPEAAALRPKHGPVEPTPSDLVGATLPPPPLALPEGEKRDDPEVVEVRAEEVPTAAGTPAATMFGVTPARSTVDEPIEPTVNPTRPVPSSATGSGDPAEPQARSSLRVDTEPSSGDRPVEATRSLLAGDPVSGPPEPVGRPDQAAESSGPGEALPSDSVRVRGPIGAFPASSPTSGADPGWLRSSGGDDPVAGNPRPGSREDRVSIGPVGVRDSKMGGGGGTVGVRSSLAIGPRDLSPSPGVSADPVGASMESGVPGSGPAGDLASASGSSSSQGGGTADMAKTNELLQQILEAVRRQREAALPAGGSSVYSGR